MTWRFLTGLIILTLTMPALANDELLPDAVAVQHWKLARIRTSGRTYFYQSEKDGCPALTARCRQNSYVVPGDLVLVGDAHGPLVNAAYTDANGKPTTGWLPGVAFELIAPPDQGEAAWVGVWSYDEATIDIDRAGHAGRLKASGLATWGGHDPERVRRGGINTGDFYGEAPLKGGWILFGTPRAGGADDYDCRVSLHLVGPYLVGADNLNCGGVNVSFMGVYRRISTHPNVESQP